MPPTRRNPTTRAQRTLAFGPNSNKVTKPSLASQSKKLSKPSSETLQKAATAEVVSTPEPEIAAGDDEEHEQLRLQEQLASPRTLAIRHQTHVTTAQPERSELEQKAAKISETQVRKYWKGKEDERSAPRVHQQGLSVHEKILRHFDLSSQYGVSFPWTAILVLGIELMVVWLQPCIGMPRVRRWKRADGLGLKPPIEVLAVLMMEEKSKNSKAERAFMEGLLTSRLAINE